MNTNKQHKHTSKGGSKGPPLKARWTSPPLPGRFVFHPFPSLFLPIITFITTTSQKAVSMGPRRPLGRPRSPFDDSGIDFGTILIAIFREKWRQNSMHKSRPKKSRKNIKNTHNSHVFFFFICWSRSSPEIRRANAFYSVIHMVCVHAAFCEKRVFSYILCRF